MKLNRFGMTEKTLAKIIKAWADKTISDIKLRWMHDGGTEQRKKDLDEVKSVLTKTFLSPDPDVTYLMGRLTALEQMLGEDSTQALAAQA